ncbi:ubiquitin-like modifier 1 [Pisolithus croceorrhizus]|nr:ubiquitin-like modifier 1 [Pisolithus croceorrhizus]KAI6163496.1 ubiquitin-like modifier 1 [Pisolithus thermaeus]
MSTITVKVEFGGGLELLFGNKRSHSISLPSSVPTDKTIAPPNSESPQPQKSNDLPLPLNGPNQDSTNGPVDAKTKPLDVQYLMHYLRARLLTERPELFMEGDTVRPGILVLINDTDWELEGEGAYEISDGDEIVFISTLHGG